MAVNLHRMKFPPSHLSNHACQRLRERFKIEASELLRLLNSGLGKKIGVSAQTQLAHRLVWSPIDQAFLVAIQNVVDGAVLTVLTIEMYQRDYESNLTEKRLRHVVNQMVHSGHAPTCLWKQGDADEIVSVYATLATSTKTVALGRWRGLLASADLSKLGRQPEFWAWVARTLEERGYDIHALEEISAKFSGCDHKAVPYQLASDA